MPKYETNMFELPSREPEGIVVRVRKNDIDGALKVLKRKIIQEGLIKDIRKKEFYETGSQRKKRKKIEARIRWLRKKRQLENE